MECAKILLDAGANVNQQTHYGWTALLTATQNRHYQLAAYLMERGANTNIANNGGWTPLYLATDNRNPWHQTPKGPSRKMDCERGSVPADY